MTIIGMHAYTKKSGKWEETPYTKDNDLTIEEMTEYYADTTTWKYVQRSLLWNLPVKTSVNPDHSRTVTFYGRHEMNGPTTCKVEFTFYL